MANGAAVQWLTAREAAERLRLSLDAFYQRVYRGHIPVHRLGRTLRFRPEELDAALTPPPETK